MKNEKNYDCSNDVELVLLKFADNKFELDMIESILKDNSIPYILVDNEASGGYMKLYSGVSMFGTNVMVNKEDLEKAQELIAI